MAATTSSDCNRLYLRKKVKRSTPVTQKTAKTVDITAGTAAWNDDGITVYTDYAHHPAELKCAVGMAAELKPKRLRVLFQPHRYSRTKALFNEFAQVLSQPDVTYLAEIFAARETNDVGVTSEDLAGAVPGAKAAPSLEVLTGWLAEEARPGDLILTVGAGNIYTVGEDLARMGENA